MSYPCANSYQFNFATAPITNARFHERVKQLYKDHVKEVADSGLPETKKFNPSSPSPNVPTLTDEDTSLGPCPYIGNVLACCSPWIDLGSSDPVIASISRQVLNLEVAFANWCGVKCVVVSGPRQDDDGRAIVQYARAIQETFDVASRVNIIIHISMYREPGLEEEAVLLSTELLGSKTPATNAGKSEEVDLFGSWETWHTIRSVCNYSNRLFAGESSQHTQKPCLKA